MTQTTEEYIQATCGCNENGECPCDNCDKQCGSKCGCNENGECPCDNCDEQCGSKCDCDDGECCYTDNSDEFDDEHSESLSKSIIDTDEDDNEGNTDQ